jgi:RNA polymerase sigma-70 factor (ECF subfamily)
MRTEQGSLEDAVVAAARTGDQSAFATVVEQHRRELIVHCYRMTGAMDEAEDLVQETFLKAWKGIGGFEGRSSLRAWLYRIATNTCLDALASRFKRSRRTLPYDLSPPNTGGQADNEATWLQPLPDRMWEPAAPGGDQPDSIIVARETIELSFIAAIQVLAPHPRAVLIMRDVLGWSARDTAEQLGLTVASANSYLTRARAALRERLPDHHGDWSPTERPSDEERLVLDRYMTSIMQGDLAAIAALLTEDVKASMPPFTFWFRGRDHMMAALAESWNPSSPNYVGIFRALPTSANGQPAAACFTRQPGDDEYHPFAVSVLDVWNGGIREIVAFHDPGLFPKFGMPATLPAI